MKSFTLPPRESVATPEILVTSHISDKSHLTPPGKSKKVDFLDAGGGGSGGGGSDKKGGGSDKKEGLPTDKKKEDFEDGGVPLIYLCATCWHETEEEMLALLKSLFR